MFKKAEDILNDIKKPQSGDSLDDLISWTIRCIEVLAQEIVEIKKNNS